MQANKVTGNLPGILLRHVFNRLLTVLASFLLRRPALDLDFELKLCCLFKGHL